MRRWLPSTLCIAALTASTGCGAVGSTNNADQLAKTLTIYSSLPLQGPDHDRQQSIVNGEKLALAQAGGHVGPFHVSIASLDDADPTKGSWTSAIASQAARQAAQDKSTIAFIGDFDSGATAVSLPLINESNILQISPAASYSGLTRAGVGTGEGEPERYYPSGVRSFARLVPSDAAQARPLAAYVRAEGVRRLTVLSDHDPFDAAAAELLARQAPSAGLKLLARRQLDSQAAGTQLRALADQAPDGIMLSAAAGPGAAGLLRALHGVLPRARLFIGAALAAPAFLASLDGATRGALRVFSPVLRLRDYPPAARQVLRDYRRQFAQAGGVYALYGYEAMRSALAAVRAAGSKGADRLAVVRAYFGAGRRDSVLGGYSVAPDGDTSLQALAGYRVDRAGKLRFEHPLS
ncbi:MAG: branched-chain amino acid ABC transporter substrate-binding protein [Solirubrobacteraceae bacterium]